MGKSLTYAVSEYQVIYKINLDPVRAKACPVEKEDFESFLRNLFHSSNPLSTDIDRSVLLGIPPFSDEELDKALRELSNLRCADEIGL